MVALLLTLVFSVIMITIALATVLKSAVTVVWGTQIMVFDPPIFSQEAICFGTVRVLEIYLWTVGFAFLFLGVFAAFFKFIHVGIRMRAVANSQTVAQSIGIRVKKVFAISWSIGALVSVVGSVLLGSINGINSALAGFGLRSSRR